MKVENYFFSGFRAMLPVITGAIPFGAVMGTVCAQAKLSLMQTLSMNFLVYAGAAQLAAVDLMEKNTAVFIIFLTGLVINLRYLLYSAALSPIVHRSSFLTKFFCSYIMTDQAYAVMSAHQDKLKSNEDAIKFYLGASVCMAFAWHLSMLAGYSFGNFASADWSLDFAVPLSFVSLLIPTFKNRKYVFVAILTSGLSLLFYTLPFKLGLILTSIFGIAFAFYLTRERAKVS